MTTGTVAVGRVRAALAHPEKRVTLAFLVTGFAALLVGALIGPLQALNYAGVDLYSYVPILASYYQGLTLHGVLNALVFTTFAICGLILYLPAREMNIRPNMTWVWSAYWLMLGGLLMAGIAVATNTSSVMYTFYPPLMGHWGFYIGLTLVVLGSLMVGGHVIHLRYMWKRDHPDQATPIVAYMSVVTWYMWFVAVLGLVIEMVFFLIPWSLGIIDGVDPQLARTLFWYTGHPIVYFWLLPAYVSWYGLVPRQAGGELVSDGLARLAFLMFLLFSTPVGFHHQFTDPGIPAAWKLIHSLMTMMVGIPSLLTAFTVAASLEIGGRRRGGRGVFGWIPKLPWGNAAFTAQVLAMISFIFGGAGGIINASFNLNVLVHNTTWVPGHFHVTVGTATTLTFMGIAFWLVPHLTRKPLFSNRLALWASWLWFVGMMVFALGMHWQGLQSVPRRAHVSNLAENLQGAYAEAAVPAFVTGISGVILFFAVILFFTVLLGTLFARRQLTEAETPEIPWAQDVVIHNEGITKFLDRLVFWVAAAFVLVIIAYAPVLIDMFLNQVPVGGLRLW